MHRLNAVFSRYEKAFSNLSEADREAAIDIISSLADVIQLVNEPIGDKEPPIELKTIRNYLTKKLADARSPASSELESRYLLNQFRNELAHGKFHRKYGSSDTKKLAPFFWKVLEKSAPHWNPHELSNILAYCLHTSPNTNEGLSSDQKKIVRAYKAIFNALDEERKTSAFIELTLRLLSEPTFKGTLDSMVHA